MAACSPLDGEVTPTDKSGASSATQASNIQYNNSSVVASVSSATPVNDRIEGEEAYEEVANLNDEEFRNFLEEVTNATKVPNKKKNYISPRAKFLLQKEEDALREESGSGEDCSDLALTHRKKRVIGRREQQRDHGSSAASRTSTGGSLGSLHDLTDIKPPKKSGGTHQGVASRSIEGGSCGNLSRGSFETQPPQKRKGKRSKNASASQREGGSLQNLSKTESGGGDSKVLQKSGSLSQVFTDAGGGARTKIRRQKTPSESSSARYSRCAEDREGDSSADEGLEQEFPYQPLNQSPHSTLSTHSADHQFFPALPSEWSNDSTVAEHQTDEASESDSSDDGTDAMHRSANDVLACYTQEKERNVERGLELQQITCTTAQCDNLTDHGCFDNYTLHRNQDSSSSSNSSMSQKIPLRLQESCVPVLKGGNIIIRADEDTSEKRRCNISSFESNAEVSYIKMNKPSLDENGNPVLSGGSANSKSCSSNPSGSISTVHTRRAGFTTQKESNSNYERLRTRKNKKAKKGEKQYSENFPGFRGYQDLESILKFLGAEESSSTNNKKNKKNKSKKEDVKEEKECSKKKNKTVKSDVEDYDKYFSINSNNENKETCFQGDKAEKNANGGEKKVDDKLNKNKCAESRKNKKSCGTLRESNSMEDLVSKNKQNTAVKDIRKQVTMDDEVISLVSLSGTYQGQSRSLSEQKKSGKMDSVVGCSVAKLSPALCDVPTTSEFVADFYKAGDSFIDHDVEPSKGPVCGGDFELVKRKRNRRGNNTNPHCHFANRGPGNGGGVGSSNEVRFHPNGVKMSRGNPSEKPLINFTEFPRTSHESFLAHWSYTGVGERYGTTTSAPHSEDSDSDGGDSVHSMPAPSITPRPSVRKPSPSTDSTPQASYANIARQAANANRAQMRRMAPVVDPVMDQEDKVVASDVDKPCVTQEVNKVNESCSESSVGNILDGNFPSLAESVGGLLSPGGNQNIPMSDSKTTTVEGPVLALKENEFPQLNNKECVTVNKVSSDIANCKLYPKNSYKVQNDKNREVKLSRVTGEKLDNVLSNNSQNINEKNVIINYNHSDLLMNKRIINISPKNDDNSRAWLKESKCVFVCNTVSSSSLTSETSPSKKPEPVIFADHAKFSISASGVEFGFDDSLVTSSDNGNIEKNLPAVVDNQEEKCDTSVKISNNVVKDFSKWYQAPKNDQISYNYEELLKHFSKEWKVTLRQMEEDPMNIQYWQAAPSTPAPLCAAEADTES